MANKDGFEPGQQLDIATLVELRKKQRDGNKPADPEPKKRVRTKKVEDPKEGIDDILGDVLDSGE